MPNIPMDRAMKWLKDHNEEVPNMSAEEEERTCARAAVIFAYNSTYGAVEGWIRPGDFFYVGDGFATDAEVMRELSKAKEPQGYEVTKK